MTQVSERSPGSADTGPIRSDMQNAAAALLRLQKDFQIPFDTSDINLRGFNFRAFTLPGADFSNAMLDDSTFSYSDLTSAKFAGARLERANFSFARLEGADFAKSRIEGANFTGSRLEGADFAYARLEKTFFNDARLDGADLHNARLDWVRFRSATLRRANLAHAYLDHADFSHAALEGAHLRGTHLTYADLFEASFDETTDFRGANVVGATIKHVNASTAKLSQGQLISMFGDTSVLLPDSIQRPAHWPSTDLDITDFYDEWTRWKSDPVTYLPPQDRPENLSD